MLQSRRHVVDVAEQICVQIIAVISSKIYGLLYGKFIDTHAGIPSLPFPPVLSSCLLSIPYLPLPVFPFSSLHLPLPVEICPLYSSQELCGSAVSSPGRVWGGVPAEIDFDAFEP